MRTNTAHAEPKWVPWLEWATLIAIIALATYLRYWRITAVPPGFNSDEAVGAMGALTTLREGLQYSYEGQGGGGALGFYFAAAAFYLFGPSIAAIRGLAAWAGVIGIFANYWAIRELFRGPNHTLSDLNRARLIAGLATLGVAVSLWHLKVSRIAFAGIGVPFLMLPSVYFLWLGLNKTQPPNNKFGLSEAAEAQIVNLKRQWPFIVSGIFLGGLMYIYLSGVFAPPFYAAYFIAQWLLVMIAQKTIRQNLGGKFWRPEPARAYLTTQFWNLLATALTATLLLLPMVYILLTRPELEPGTTRVAQAFFLNPQINQGDPWGLLWRSIEGNFSAYGVSLSWLFGQAPARLVLPVSMGLLVFLGFLLSLWRGLRGQAAYLFILLWYPAMLLPSILSPDSIPHDLRAVGAITPTYVFTAVFIIWLFETLWAIGARWLQPRLGHKFKGLAFGLGVGLACLLIWILGQDTARSLYQYFYIFPNTNDAKAAFHVYAVEMADQINREERAGVAFILPRNTAAGDVFRNYTTDFLTALAQPPAAHYWVVDNEKTLANDLATAAVGHNIIRVVKWKTSKHTGADPKNVIPYYLEKYGHYRQTDSFEYFDIDTYLLDSPAPDFHSAEKLQTIAVDFGGQLQLTGYALGDAGDVQHLADPQAASNNLLWLRLAWQKTAEHAENLKVSAQVYAANGQLISQIDKLLQNNILQVGSQAWEVGAEAETYFLISIPPATPPGDYTLKLAVYGADSLSRLPISTQEGDGLLTLANFTVQPARQPLTPDDLTLALPTMHKLLPGLTLVGFETLPGESVRSGSKVGASLIWQAGDTPLPGDLAMSFIVKPESGDDEWPISEPVGLAGDYPTSRWQPGEVLRGWLAARIPPAWEPGTYKLRLRLSPLDQPDEEVITLPIGDFEIEGWPRNFETPQPQVEIGADFNGQVTLAGLDATATQVSPGDTLGVRLYWHVNADFDQDHTAFIHLIGPDGLLHGQVDQTPGAGAYPTTGWLPDEFITDEYAIPIPPESPAGDYQIEIGLYNPNTGRRLPVCQTEACAQVDDKVLLPGLTVQ
ncbi:MAG: hypothetical protein JW953_22285 [Anaerolineae bacterium]|nr:hypothetical protein [Anaerolineae bacterium]